MVGIRVKLLFPRSRRGGGRVNVFVGVGNGLPTALLRACPRLKILMAPHWYCRVTPGSVPAGSVSRENSGSRDPGLKIAGGGVLVGSETKI